MVFLVTYPRGYVKVVVENFFVVSTIPNIKSLFKLASKHCSESEKQSLIDNLILAKAYWTDWYYGYWERGDELARRMWNPTTRTQLNKVLARLDTVIGILKKERWNV